jgi:hypothetical protein
MWSGCAPNATDFDTERGKKMLHDELRERVALIIEEAIDSAIEADAATVCFAPPSPDALKYADRIHALYSERIASLAAERDEARRDYQIIRDDWSAIEQARETAEAERDAAVESVNVLMRDPAEARSERLAAALREIADATAHAMANAPAPRSSWYAEYRRWVAPYISSIDETSRRALAGEARTPTAGGEDGR